jgi:hypothetical protein
MNCKKCGYKLTELFTSYACDRCDGLVEKAEPAGVVGWMLFDKWFEHTFALAGSPTSQYWAFVDESGADQQLKSFTSAHKVAVMLNRAPTKISEHPLYGKIFAVHKLQKTDTGWTAEVVE